MGSRGSKVDESTQLWLKGPEWLSKQDNWPDDITTVSTVESRAERKPVKEILAIVVEEKNLFDDLLEKYDLWKTIKIMAWISDFLLMPNSEIERRYQVQLLQWKQKQY